MRKKCCKNQEVDNTKHNNDVPSIKTQRAMEGVP